MSNSEKINFKTLRDRYTQICIPEIQRDYVMGSGGKTDNGTDKLDNLLYAIYKAYKNKEDFNFSCIIAHEDEDTLEIYDGQQRLVTLLIMIIFNMLKDNRREELEKYGNLLSFKGRDSAYNLINYFIEKSWKFFNNSFKEDIKKKYIVDFSTFSIYKLLDKLNTKCLPDTDYLLNNIKFDMVLIDSKSDTEQFFMDLNSGIKLKEYELYKAKLVHHIGKLAEKKDISEEQKEALIDFPHKMDNEWLNFFDTFSEFQHPAEEYEVAFIKYCLKMLDYTESIDKPLKEFLNNSNDVEKKFNFLQDKYGLGYNSDSIEKYDENNVDKLDENIIFKTYKIINSVSKLDYSDYKYPDDIFNVLVRNLNNKDFSAWKVIKKIESSTPPEFWNLDYEGYDRLSYHVIKTGLLNNKGLYKSCDMYTDVLLWCYITTLNSDERIQKNYLRLIKILLNHNTRTNNIAYYSSPSECSSDDTQYLHYCKYYVWGIPRIYKANSLKTENDENKSNHLCNGPIWYELRPCTIRGFEYSKNGFAILYMFSFNKWVTDENLLSKPVETVLIETKTDTDIDIAIAEALEKTQFNYINQIIRKRTEILKTFLKEHSYDGYINKENQYLGIFKKIENPIIDGYYLGKVKLRWPIKAKTPASEECYVRLKCETDLLFEEFNRTNDAIIRSVLECEYTHIYYYNNGAIPYTLKGDDLINRCFFIISDNVKEEPIINKSIKIYSYILKNRASFRFKTYDPPKEDYKDEIIKGGFNVDIKLNS